MFICLILAFPQLTELCKSWTAFEKTRMKINLQYLLGLCCYSAHPPDSNPNAVMKMLIRTVKKTKRVDASFIVFSLGCFLTSFRSYFTEGNKRKHVSERRSECFQTDASVNQPMKTSRRPTMTCSEMDSEIRAIRGM